jgi:hypothetical protein
MTKPPTIHTIFIEPTLFLSITPSLEYGDIIYYNRLVDLRMVCTKYMVRKHEFNRTKIVEQIDDV